MTKQCGKCGKQQSLDKFSKFKSSPDGLTYTCKECVKEYDKKHYEDNKEVILQEQKVRASTRRDQKAAYDKQWRLIHKQELAVRDQLYFQEHKQEILAKQRQRKVNDPKYKLAALLRTRLWTILSNKTLPKKSKLLDYLGCTLPELLYHLEKQFKPGMTWENQGEWHVDHILPLTPEEPITEEEMYKRCHFTNLQPLWAIDNIRKGNKLS